MSFGYGAGADYPVRTATVGYLRVIDVALSSIIKIGDYSEAAPRLRALAVQRESRREGGGDVFFESYPIFDRRRPVLIDPVAEAGQEVRIERLNRCPRISVGIIRVTAVSAASIVQAGNGMRLASESRIKHIRQYRRPRPYPGIECP